MKKLFLLAVVCSFFAVGTVNAQNENYYGAQKGSWAITVGADPVIDFVGNMFNGTQDNYLNYYGAKLAGKYFIGDKIALTAGVSFNNYKDKEFSYGNPNDDKEVTNTYTEGFRNFSLNVGAQYYFRPGKRFQPFVAADLVFGRDNEDFTIDKDFEYKEDGDVVQYDGKLKTSAPVNMFGCYAKIGVECFLSKSVSISAALDLGVRTSTYKSVQKYETEDPDATTEYIDSQNYKVKTSRTTYFATGSMNGNIAFNFYF